MRFPLAALAAALVIAAVVLPASPAAAASRCAQDRATPAYSGSVFRALRSKRRLTVTVLAGATDTAGNGVTVRSRRVMRR